MLKAVAALCDRYSLRYSIYCGTLLGAVRHKGFIPWDDDIDLAMPLEDYRWLRSNSITADYNKVRYWFKMRMLQLTG